MNDTNQHPISEETGGKNDSIVESATSKTHETIAKGVQHANLVSTPGAGAHMAGYFLHPGADFFHRISALFFALVIVAGIYSMFDRPFGTTILARVSDGASSVASAMRVAFGEEPDCASNPQRFTAAAISAVRGIFASIDAAMPSGIERTSPTYDNPCPR